MKTYIVPLFGNNTFTLEAESKDEAIKEAMELVERIFPNHCLEIDESKVIELDLEDC